MEFMCGRTPKALARADAKVLPHISEGKGIMSCSCFRAVKAARYDAGRLRGARSGATNYQ